MRMLVKVLFVVAMVIAAVQIHSAHAISLNTLTANNGSIQQGDKLFTNFSFPQVLVSSGDITPSSYADINVQGVTVSGEHGLRFSGPFSATFAPEGGIGIATYHISFDVSVTDPSALIHDVRHSYVVTHSGGGFEDRNVTANTDVRTCPFVICFGPGQFSGVGPTSSLLPINTHPSPTNVNNNVVLPNDVNFLKVDQDIFIVAGSIAETAAQSVSFPSIDVTFSQALVPEPSTILLLASGMAGLWFRKKGLRPNG